MPDIEVKDQRTIQSLWNLPCENCRIKTRNFYVKENVRLCSEACYKKWSAMPHKKDKAASRDCIVSPDEIEEIDGTRE